MKHGIKKLFRNRKAFNDIVIIATIMSILLVSAFVIPYLSDLSGENYDEYDDDTYIDDIHGEATSVNQLNAFTVLINVLKLASFDIGNTLDLPLFLRLIYGIMGVILILVVARNIWIGGGG